MKTRPGSLQNKDRPISECACSNNRISVRLRSKPQSVNGVACSDGDEAIHERRAGLEHPHVDRKYPVAVSESGRIYLTGIPKCAPTANLYGPCCNATIVRNRRRYSPSSAGRE